MKSVLVIYYSQSGQLDRISRSITRPLEKEGVDILYYEIEMKKDFPFPWTKDAFFDAFPESFLEIPSEILPPPEEVLKREFDLVILAWQVWFLSPSIPVNSFLQSKYALEIVSGKPVVTVIGCRNMWVMAQEKMKKQLENLRANLVGNIVLVDRAPNLISVITIVKWMFSGSQKRYLGIFPKPGVSENDITQASRFGETILKALKAKRFERLQKDLVEQQAVNVSEYLVKTDKKGSKIFSKWANFIVSKNRSRRTWLKVFNVYLLLAIWIISPIVYIVHVLTYSFTKNKRRNTIKYYQGV